MRIFPYAYWALCVVVLAIQPRAMAQYIKPLSARKIVFELRPKYPVQALSNHLSGRVRLQVSVGTDGKVRSEEVVGGNPMLADAAVKAVEQWKWEPSPRPSSELVEITFEGQP